MLYLFCHCKGEQIKNNFTNDKLHTQNKQRIKYNKKKHIFKE